MLESISRDCYARTGGSAKTGEGARDGGWACSEGDSAITGGWANT